MCLDIDELEWRRENHPMPIRGGGKESKSKIDPGHLKRKGTAAIKARKQKRQERKNKQAGGASS